MEDDDQFEFVENNEAEKTSYLLLENEFRLYQGENSPECPEEDCEDDHYGMKRYYSEGYEANVYKADDKELMEWRDLFHCMHVVGEGITNEIEEMPTSIYQTKDSTPHPPLPNTHLEVANILKSNEGVLWKEIISDLSGYVKHTIDAADRLNISTDLKELDKLPVQEYSDDFW
jgi:hypothetical protein